MSFRLQFRGRQIWLGLAWLTLAVLPQVAWAQTGGPLSESEREGRTIYRQGISPSGGQILARLEGNEVEIPASSLPCTGCHGQDGRGRPEGGVNPSDLTWASLTRPYTVEHPSGRRHEAYDERSLKRAIAMGVDPAGNALGVAMPRYLLSQEDMTDLLAYLRRLGNEPEPGISEQAIVLAALLPEEGPVAEVNRTRRSALEACAADLNSRGGIHGRQVELRFVSTGRGAGALRPLLEAEEVFALVGGSIQGSEAAVDRLLLDLGVPAVAPFTLNPELLFPANPNLFYLYTGLGSQMRALALGAAARVEVAGPNTAIVYRANPLTNSLAADLAEEVLAQGWPEPLRLEAGRLPPLPELMRDLQSSGIEALFFLSEGGLARRAMATAAMLDWHPLALGPGALLGPELARPAEEVTTKEEGQIHLTYPTLPNDRLPAAMTKYGELAMEHGLPRNFLGAQLEQVAAFTILSEGLRRAGRSLTRAKLVAALEELREFHPGYTPPVTYGPGTRAGATGTYLLPLGLTSATPSGAAEWIDLP